MKIPFDYSIDDWLSKFQELFEIFADFLKRAFNIDLFTEEDHFNETPPGVSDPQ